MLDRCAKNIQIGDYVRFWHNRNGAGERTDIGEVISITDGFAKIKFQNQFNSELHCFRSKSGLTKLTDSEAMLYIFEKNTI